MRLLLYNPNTDRALTASLADAARQRMASDDVLLTATSENGAAFVGSEETVAVARAAAIASLPAHAADCDAILLGCFGDLGLDELRRKLRRPAVSLSDAFFALLPFLGIRVGILTTSSFWRDRLAEDARRKNVESAIAAIEILDISVGWQADGIEGTCRAAMADLASRVACDAVALAGAALTPVRDRLCVRSPLTILDPMATAIGLCRLGANASFGSGS